MYFIVCLMPDKLCYVMLYYIDSFAIEITINRKTSENSSRFHSRHRRLADVF